MTERQFLKDINSFSTHRPLLWLALNETEGDIVEYGTGSGSTPYLSQYSRKHDRYLYSYEDHEYYYQIALDISSLNKKHLVTFVDSHTKWFDYAKTDAGVVLIDYSQGRDRHLFLKKFTDINGIVVCHDTEPSPCGGDYNWDKTFPLFKYKVDLTTPMNGDTNGAWATALSNTHDVTRWSGKEFGQYKLITRC